MKKLIVIAALVSLMAGAIYGQAVPGGFQSPTSQASMGRYRSAADDFIRPDSYTSARVNNWFGMTSFQSGNTAHIGYANKLENLYIGAYYGGTFWANAANPVYTEARTQWHGKDKNDVRAYNAIPDLVALSNPNNRLSLLIGAADMGFRVSLYSNLNTFKDGDFIYGGDEYKSYEAANGTISPQIAWSMTKNLVDGKGIKPFLTFDLDFNNNYAKATGYDSADNYKATEEYILNSQNNIYATLEAGLGGFTLHSQNGFSFSADLDYRMRLRSWNSEYNYDDANGKNKIASYKGQYTGGSSFKEETYNNHRIRPSFSGSWSKETLGLKFKFNLPVEITNTGNSPLGYEKNADGVNLTNGSLVLNGAEVNTTTIGFTPQLQLAAQWKIVPKLTMNVGGQITLTQLGQTKEETSKTYDNGKAIDAPTNVASVKTTAIHGVSGDFQNVLGLGVALNATDNMTLEASCGVGGVGNNNSISVFATGNTGLLYFSSLLASIKF